jgi:cytochrome c-type biogenesis protein CcmH
VWTTATAALVFVSALGVAADGLESEAKAIEAMLVAPCCWSQQVSVHQSEAAAEIKGEIRVALKAGRTRQQIVDAYVDRYGARILIEPPASGFAAWLYVLPVVTLLVSAGGFAFVVKRFARRGASTVATPEPSSAGNEELTERLDDELRDLD